MNKIAILFPGVGYHTDKPLLYYGRMLAKEYGYQIIEVKYGGFQTKIRGDKEKMQQAFEHAMRQAEEILSKEKIENSDDLLCISKSVGTVVSAAWQKKQRFQAKNIYFTPVEATFQFAAADSGIVFHGTSDPWVETSVVEKCCEQLHLPLYLTQDANHSMECGHAAADLRTIQKIFSECEAYLQSSDVVHHKIEK